jgi:hypothetical protein
MTLPGETEAGSAGMQPCRGIAWWAHRDDVAGRGSSPFALCPKPYRIGRPLCLENPRPEGAEYSLTESAPSPFHAEPEQRHHDGSAARVSPRYTTVRNLRDLAPGHRSSTAICRRGALRRRRRTIRRAVGICVGASAKLSFQYFAGRCPSGQTAMPCERSTL